MNLRFGTLGAGRQSGYADPRYAASLAEFGQPCTLPRSGSWLLVRSIPRSDRQDAFAGYRHLFCDDWDALGRDLDELRDLVTVTAVTDPMREVSAGTRARCFPDLSRPYKENFVIDLTRPEPSRHHRRKTRKALRSVEAVADWTPALHLDEWEELYSDLRQRHHLNGLQAFSKASFAQQLAVSGCVAFRALVDGRSVSTMLWYVMGDTAHFHLGASNALGYSLSASYALVQSALDAFAPHLRWLNLGSGPGAEANATDGLTAFKRGWSSETRPSYLCGRIVDRAAYARLSPDAASISYFPAYRRGEFD